MSLGDYEYTVVPDPPTQTRPGDGKQFDLRVKVDLPLAPGVVIRAWANARDLKFRDGEWKANELRGPAVPPKVHAEIKVPAIELVERRLLADGLGDEVWRGNAAIDRELVSAVEDWIEKLKEGDLP
jgi:hypothetical protein